MNEHDQTPTARPTPIPAAPSPTVPNQNIFEAPEVEKIDQKVKQEIIKQHGGGKKFSLKWILIALGIVIIILLAALLVRTVSNTNKNKQITLTWWGLEEDQEAVGPLISDYEKANPNVVIDFVKESPQDYRERLMNSLAQGKGPDIFEFHNSWVPMLRSNLYASGEDLSNDFYPVVSTDLKAKNGFIGVPLEYDGIALFVNQDILNAYGKSAPKTWDDLRTLAGQLTIRDSNKKIRQAGIAMGGTSNIDYWQDIFALLMLQSGADLNMPNSAAGVSALTFYTYFTKTDFIWDDTLPTSTLDFASGQLAMYFGKYSDVYKIKKQNPNLKFGVSPVPQLPSDQSAIPSISYASYFVNGVSSKSGNAKAAWSFLKFMATADTLRKLYVNEVKLRGYGNLYPRVDMQSELIHDSTAGSFLYEGGFARSWYLNGGTNDGVGGINSQIGSVYMDAIRGANGNTAFASALGTAQNGILQVLSGYGLARAPVATP